MEKRVTQRDVAREAGVSVGTVCLALRDDRRITAAVRQRVAEAAKALGYVRDPMLASLSAYRHKSAADPAGRLRIAYLCPVEFKDKGDDNTILRGLRERANELGYGLETFFWQRSPEDLARKLRMCRARGIRGIIVQARGDSVGGWPVHLSGFAVVLIGGDPGDVYRSVVAAYFENARRATAHLLDAGYRRVGLLLPVSTPAHVLDRYRTGYLVAAGLGAMNGNTSAITELGRRIFLGGKPADVERWIREERLGAVLLGGAGTSFLPFFERLRTESGGTFGYAILDKKDPESDQVTGMRLARSRIGAEAANTLDAFLAQNRVGHDDDEERGLLLVPGHWDAGTTAPVLPANAKSKQAGPRRAR